MFWHHNLHFYSMEWKVRSMILLMKMLLYQNIFQLSVIEKLQTVVTHPNLYLLRTTVPLTAFIMNYEISNQYIDPPHKEIA